jgi:1-acyl-sn-glycerol-3-phosphate acyltransferase
VADARFVAKREVQGWPLFGLLARFDGSVFIGRTAADLRTAGAALRQQLAGGRSLVLFPEGTSSDGSRVLPFKSSLLEVLRGEDETPEVTVQPVSLIYLRMRGGPLLDVETRPLFAWFGDMDLLPHIWRVFRLRGVEVVVSFREPLDPRAFDSRKELAARAHWEVSAGLEEMWRAPLAPRQRVRRRRARAA